MKYTSHIKFSDIKNRYAHVIAWGTGPLFQTNYIQTKTYKPEFVIDGRNEEIGNYCKKLEIKNDKSLINLNGNILIVIYTIYEEQILKQIGKYNNKEREIDTIIYPLLDIELKGNYLTTRSYSKNGEGFLTLLLCRQLHMDNIQYLEIGVCHPVIRNNTYLLNEQFSHNNKYKGVLVEANPLCWNLIKQYRPNDLLIESGVGDFCCEKTFYTFPNLLGHSTFLKPIANGKIKNGIECKPIQIKIRTINNIISENFSQIPDLLALDAEGLDLSILKSWNSQLYPFKIIITEIDETNGKDIIKFLMEKNYNIYAKTLENIIWVKNEYKLSV